MQISLLNGVFVSGTNLRTSLPRNLVPVPKASGISSGFLRPADGLLQFGPTAPGIDRGGINWNGKMHRVMGTSLVRVDEDGAITTLATVAAGGPVTFDYSFDRLAFTAGKKLYYWDGTSLSQVVDPDLGDALDMIWVDGYFMTTDGTSLVVTELDDPYAVNPLKYGSAETDPDPIMSIEKQRGEVYAIGRYTIEVFQNIGGNLFPFQRIAGAQIQRGALGTYASAKFVESIAFLGSGRNEAPSVYLAANGNTQKLATQEIDTILLEYTEAELAAAEMDVRVDKAHQHLILHLPDRTLVFDAAASAVLGEPIWFEFTSSIIGKGQYLCRHLVYAYGKWIGGDPTTKRLCELTESVSSHYGEVNGWDFGVSALYNEGKGAIVHEVELVGLPGNAAFGDDPVIWSSYSVDGRTWSAERPIKAGKTGETDKRLAWRRFGHMRNWRIQKFRGTSDAHLSFIRLDMAVEPLA